MTTPATVATWDPTTRSGTLLGDDGARLAFPGAALDPAVRLLRSGQRVRVELDGGRVTAVRLPFLDSAGHSGRMTG